MKGQAGRVPAPDFLILVGLVLMFVTSLGMFFPDTTTVLFDALTRQPGQLKEVTNYYAFAAIAFTGCLTAVCLGHALRAAGGSRHLVRIPAWLLIMVAGGLLLVGQAACYRNFIVLAQSSTVPKVEEWTAMTTSAATWKYTGAGLLVLVGLLGCATRIRLAVGSTASVSGRFWSWGATFFAAASALWQFVGAFRLNEAIQLLVGSATSPKPAALAELAQNVMLSGAAAACTLIACGFCGCVAVRGYQRAARL